MTTSNKVRGVGGNNQGYNSFSGVDIKAVFGSQILGELQAISYSISREKAPLYTMGSADCRSYSRGKRGIAGTLIFLMFDRHAFLGSFGSGGSQDIARAGAADGAVSYQPYLDEDEKSFSDNLKTDGKIASTNTIGDLYKAESTGGAESTLNGLAKAAAPYFSDQVLPFDVTLAAANEYGSLAVMRIYGCEILNEGYGVSIDDIVSEQQMSYVARTIMPWNSIVRTASDKESE